MIPSWDTATGHLPPGRYRTTLVEVHERFVADTLFDGSSTRQNVWDGFIQYLAAWQEMEDKLASVLGGGRIAMLLWLGGSFISQKLDPSNLDVTVIVDGELVDSCRGKSGIGLIKRLSHRDEMLTKFKVSPCVIRYRYFRSPFRSQIVGIPELEGYVMFRGAFDDWWQRARPADAPKGEPSRDTAATRRGYLEVEA